MSTLTAAHAVIRLHPNDDVVIATRQLVSGTANIDELGEAIFRMMLDCASGTRTKSELHGYGQSEFVPWQVGVVT